MQPVARAGGNLIGNQRPEDPEPVGPPLACQQLLQLRYEAVGVVGVPEGVLERVGAERAPEEELREAEHLQDPGILSRRASGYQIRSSLRINYCRCGNGVAFQNANAKCLLEGPPHLVSDLLGMQQSLPNEFHPSRKVLPHIWKPDWRRP